jgi:hypothetical protein
MIVKDGNFLLRLIDYDTGASSTLLELLDPEAESSILIRNVGTYVHFYTA